MTKTFKELMNDAGITQKEMAEELGFHQTLISQWQLGKGKPSITVVSKIAKMLKVKPEAVIKCFEK